MNPIFIYFKELVPFFFLVEDATFLERKKKSYLLTGFLLASVSKESAKEYRRLGEILRHCLISRADGEEQTEEFHR